jgi:hypothetical protein
VAPTDASSIFQNNHSVTDGGDTYAQAATPPSGDALIVDTVHVGIYEYGSGVDLYLLVQNSTSCGSNSQVGNYFQYIATTGDGDIDVPLAPGVVVPSGDSLCLLAFGTVEATVSVSGYTIPAAAATNEPVHRFVPTAVPTSASQ